MYAIIETGGKQYKVQPGQVIEVELLESESDKVNFDRVLLCGDGETVKVGTPVVDKAVVKASVLADEVKAKKVLAFKKHRRKDWKWVRGHRQRHARVRIDEIALS